MSYYLVRQGDHLDAIAHRFRVPAEQIWQAPENEGLRARRRDGNVLAPGDPVYIPGGPRPPRALPCAAGQSNRFRATVPRTHVVLELAENGRAIRNEAYRFVASGVALEGQSDGRGRVTLAVPVDLRRGRLEVPARHLVYEIEIGSLDPIDEVTGYQARLAQLGYYHGAVDGDHGSLTEGAVRELQREEGLAETGTMDEPTRARLCELYGC